MTTPTPGERVIYERWALLKPDGQVATASGCIPLIYESESMARHMHETADPAWWDCVLTENQCESLRIAKVKLIEVTE